MIVSIKVVAMSDKVKQANFRLPLQYVDMIDKYSSDNGVTKAVAIEHALDALYSSGLNSSADVEDTSRKISELEEKLRDALTTKDSLEKEKRGLQKLIDEAGSADDSELRDALRRAEDAEAARDDAESRARFAMEEKDASLAELNKAKGDLSDALSRLDDLEKALQEAEAKVTKLERELDEAKKAGDCERELEQAQKELADLRRALADNESARAELERKLRLAAEDSSSKDERISSLKDQLSAANATTAAAKATAESVKAIALDPDVPSDENSQRALTMLNMLTEVMGAFQQQVADARAIGEQEGRAAVKNEMDVMVKKAHNEGYEEALEYIDSRVTDAHSLGAREERAKIANMRFFQRLHYLRVHVA